MAFRDPARRDRTRAPIYRTLQCCGAIRRSASQSGIRLALPPLVRRLSSLAARTVWPVLSGFVAKRRTAVRPLAGASGDRLWRILTSRAADRAVLANYHLSRTRMRFVARIGYRLILSVMLFSIGIYVAAGQTERALTLARLMNLIFRDRVRARRRPACHVYFEVMYRAMLFERIIREVPRLEFIEDHRLNHIVGLSHLFDLNVQTAEFFMSRAIRIHPGSYADHRVLGRIRLAADDDAGATRAFAHSVALVPKTVMAHQNYAGRYDVNRYVPKDWELARAGELLIYDNLGQLAEDLFLRGRFADSFRFYGKMLAYQSGLARRRALPRPLVRDIAARHPGFDRNRPCRILPYEWVTQFGHIGLLDCYYKMSRLGMLPDANYVLCAPAGKVANPEYLGYWDKFFTIVRDDGLVDELFPYQRYFGDGFMAYRSPEGEVEPWTRAAARAQVSWARERRPALLSVSPEDDAFGRERLRAMGVPEDAWYVGLHVREGGFYGEFAGSMSEHRNASVEDYREAVREITRRGGWVIRLGDRSMRPLEPLPQVVDYARSEFKSRRMDVFLLATSRFVVGTTSGLTTAALSFGTPAVLVNCISNDWQLWSGDTDFIVKRLYDRREKRFLSLGETYRQPVQGYLINNVVTRRQGYDIHPNTAAEIAEAVRYKLDMVLGDRPRPGERNAALQRYRQAMAGNPLMFGAAHPVVPFLERHPELTVRELAELAA